MANQKVSDEDVGFDDQDDSQEDSEIELIPKEKRTLRTQAYDKSVADLVSMLDQKEIALDPHYQRSYVWDNKKASLLVESILLNVPIPVIYVEEDDESKWNVVDGLQRLNTLRRFFANEFKLTGLEVLSELNKSQFSTLNPKAQRVLKNGILRIIVILQESHPEIKYDIFQRLNRGAVRLNEQELRNCLYRGSFNELLKELRKDKTLQKILGLQSEHPRFVDAELVLRCVALMDRYDPVTGNISQYVGKMKGFLNAYMQENKNAPPKKIEEVRKKFTRSIAGAYDVFGDKTFRRVNPGTKEPERQVNRALMDVVMVSFEKFENAALAAKSREINALLLEIQKDDPEFSSAITYGTSDRAKVEYRLKVWVAKLNALMR